jgi:putative acetyltransferase
MKLRLDSRCGFCRHTRVDQVSRGAEVEIEQVAAATDEVRELIGELDQVLAAEYLPEQRHGLALEALFQPQIRFFVARLHGAAIGCGGIALFDDFAEVKRMYVRETVRGRGVADAVLTRIETEARTAEFFVLRLETGVRQAAALRFYARAGFEPCAAFGDYALMRPEEIATSIFMEKRLSPSASR